MSMYDLPFFSAAGSTGDAGKDGVSPTVTVTDITGGHRLTVIDAIGTKTIDILDGVQGPQGEKGDTGAQGIQGIPGEKGEKGETGAQGPKGDTGSAGENGLTPFINDLGNWQIGDTDTGTKAAGEAGANGKDGINGKDGKDGVGIKSITINTNGELIIIYTNSSTEVNLGKVVGNTGPQGEPGLQGPVYVLTDEDKAEIVAAVLAELGTQS